MLETLTATALFAALFAFTLVLAQAQRIKRLEAAHNTLVEVVGKTLSVQQLHTGLFAEVDKGLQNIASALSPFSPVKTAKRDDGSGLLN